MTEQPIAGTPISGNQRLVLDLSPTAVRSHWKRDGMGQAISAMERAESWTVDGQADAEKAIKGLSDRINTLGQAEIKTAIGANTDDLIDFIGFLKAGRAIYIFKWLTEIHPELAGKLVHDARAAGSDFGVILCERLRVLERQQLLSRIFAPERFSFVLEVLIEAGLIEA